MLLVSWFHVFAVVSHLILVLSCPCFYIWLCIVFAVSELVGRSSRLWISWVATFPLSVSSLACLWPCLPSGFGLLSHLEVFHLSFAFCRTLVSQAFAGMANPYVRPCWFSPATPVFCPQGFISDFVSLVASRICELWRRNAGMFLLNLGFVAVSDLSIFVSCSSSIIPNLSALVIFVFHLSPIEAKKRCKQRDDQQDKEFSIVL